MRSPFPLKKGEGMGREEYSLPIRTAQDFSTRRAIITGLPKIAAKRDFWEEEEPPCRSSILLNGKMLTA